MSLLFVDGFDDGLTAAGLKWNVWGTSIVTTTPRTGTNCMRLGTGNQFSSRVLVNTPDEHATFIAGFGMIPEAATTAEFLQFWSDGWGTCHITITIDGNNRFLVRRGQGGTLLGQSSNNSVQLAVWQHVEVKVILSDTVGEVTIRINGNVVLSLTGIDTKNGGTKTVLEGIRFWADFQAAGIRFDDLYLCNGAGTVNNTFLGDCSVQTIFPNGDGASSQWVGSDGNSVSNYALVNETTPSTANYVESGTPGNIDTYAYGDLPAGSVKGVVHRSYAAKSDTGPQSFRQTARIGGVNYPGSDVALGTGYGVTTRVLETSPATSAAWSVSEVNGAEFGVEAR